MRGGINQFTKCAVARTAVGALVALAFFLPACASTGRGKSGSIGANAVLNESGTGRAAAPRHTLREWRLEVDTGGFVQLILSSSGFYMMRHGYYFVQQDVGTDMTLMLSEVNIGSYDIRGALVSMRRPSQTTCKQRLAGNATLVAESVGQNFLLDEFASRNFVFEEFKGRKELPFLKQSLGSLDGKSPLPRDGQDADGKFATKLGCVQRQANGQISFIAPDDNTDSLDPPRVAH